MKTFFAAAFLTAAVMIALSVGGAHVALQRNTETISRIAADTMPQLTAGLRFSEAAARLAGEVPALSLLGRSDNRLAVSLEIEQRVAEVNSRLENIRLLDADMDLVSAAAQTEELINQIALVGEASARRMELDVELRRQIVSLNGLQEEFGSGIDAMLPGLRQAIADAARNGDLSALEAATEDMVATKALRSRETEVAGLLLAASLSDDLGYLSLMEEDFSSRMAALDKDLFWLSQSSAAQQMPEIEQRLSDIAFELETLARGPGSIFESRRELLALLTEEVIVLERARNKAKALSDDVSGLVVRLSQDMLNAEADVNKRYEQGRALIYASAALGLVLAGLVFWQVFRALIRHERGLREATAEAERANAVKGDFLATMSHELQTPLNGVIGLIDLLRDSRLSPDQHKLLGAMSDSAGGLSSLLRDLVDLSESEAGRLKVRAAPFDPAELIGSIASLMRPAAVAKGLSLQVDTSDTSPSLVSGDVDRIRQVLLNLTDNAIKFTRIGSVSLAVRSNPDGITFIVRDTGIGMPQSRIDQMFADFVQGESTLDRQFGGAGIGLAICRRLVHLMAGSIAAESRQGSGTTMRVTLPLPLVEPDAHVTDGAALAGYRVAVVPERGPLVSDLVAMLRQAGHDAHAESLETVMGARARIGGIDAVLLDLADQETGSLSVVWRLKTLFGDLRPAIILIGDAEGGSERFSNLGLIDHVSVPVDRPQLLAALEIAVRRKKKEGQQLPNAG